MFLLELGEMLSAGDVMMPYAAVLAANSMLALLSLSTPSRFRILRWPFALVAAVVLTLFIGTRDQVGVDWERYEEVFYSITSLPVIVGITLTEPGYALCNYLTLALGGDIHIVNLICATVLIASVLRYASLVKVDPSFALFLSTPYLLFVVGMGYTRQSVAIGLALCAIGYLGQNRVRMFYLLAILASLFHFSALVLILLVWLDSWRCLIIGLLFVAVLVQPVSQILSEPRYGQYLSDQQSSGVWFRLGIVMIGAAAVFVFHRRWAEDRCLYRLIKKATAVCLVLLPFALFSSTLVDRCCLYLFFLFLLGFGRAIGYSNKSFRSVTLVATFVFTYLTFGVWFMTSSYAAAYWLPYHSVLAQ